MLTAFFPPKIFWSFSSGLMFLRFFASWRLYFLIYAHNFFVTSVRGIGPSPTTAASSLLGFMGCMNLDTFGFVAILFISPLKKFQKLITFPRKESFYLPADLIVKKILSQGTYFF